MLDCVYVYVCRKEIDMSIAQYIINRAGSIEYVQNYVMAPNMASRVLDIVVALNYRQYCTQWKNNNAILCIFEDSSCIILAYECGHTNIMYKPAFGQKFVSIN